ncbi:hypothetical protein Tsubulata_001491, partial [Turnera subulata]
GQSSGLFCFSFCEVYSQPFFILCLVCLGINPYQVSCLR